jgi:hypothetical protein
MWLYPVPAVLALAGFLYILFMRKGFQKEIGYAAVLIILGLIIYFVRAYKRKEYPFTGSADGSSARMRGIRIRREPPRHGFAAPPLPSKEGSLVLIFFRF